MKSTTIEPLEGLTRYENWKSQWKDQASVDEFFYISEMCHPEDMLLFCKLLYPGFFYTGGAVFLDFKYDEEKLKRWFDKLDGDTQLIEKTINHIHLYDIFAGCSGDVDDRVFSKLAEVIAFSWKAALKQAFPNMKFIVDVSDTDQDYGPVVTFYQE